jgi:DNA-binding NarL/FixJ family response regulator
VPAVVILLETDVVASLLGGRYSFAAEAEEGLRLATEVGLDNSALAFRAALAWLAGLHGDEPACRQYADEVTAAGDHHMAMAYSVAQWSVALLELADGAAGAAAARLSALSAAPTGRHHPFFALMATPTLVEALVVSGGKTEAHRAAEPLLALATDGTPLWLRGLAARCTALLGGGEAEAAFADSVRLLAEAGRSFDLARSQLAFGQFLRRQRRRADAREHLRAAIDGFDRLDARPWAERARIELRATGETARRRDPSTLTRLTPQERQIAQLVSGGNSNKDVATHLFLSPRTVEYHLAKVFTKLGISSRAELIRQGEALLAPA